MKSIVDISHDFLLKSIHDQAVCIDATWGHGKDTKFFLDHHVNKVYAFEIQKDVYEKTVKTMDDPRLIAYNQGHETMGMIKEEVDAIVFNFGYCPKGDKKITTLPDTSLQAVKIGMEKLKVKGRMALVFYPHEQGREEAAKIQDFLCTRDNIDCLCVRRLFVDAPYMVGVEKKRKRKL